MAATTHNPSHVGSIPTVPTLAALQRGSSNRGFASMDPERQRYVGADADRTTPQSGQTRDVDRKSSAMPGTIGSWRR